MMADIRCGDCLEVLRTMASASVQCCITSPPYWGLRDYGVDGQLGLEATPEEYVANLVAVFREVRRVLRDDGTVFLNLGDSYASSGIYHDGAFAEMGKNLAARGMRWSATGHGGKGRSPTPPGLKPKDLVGIPWRVAFALQDDGWWLRSDIIWHKPNPMPESVTDRCTKSHEYIFMLTKSKRYYYDHEAVKERSTQHPTDWANGKPKRESKKRGDFGGKNEEPGKEAFRTIAPTRNRRDVWKISTKPYKGAHFATFPPEIPRICIKAGTSQRGACPECGAPWERVVEKGLTAHDGETASAYKQGSTANRLAMLRQAARERGEEYTSAKRTTGWRPTCECEAGEPVPCVTLDPFFGAGTVGMVAIELGRDFVGVDLNPEYIKLAQERMATAQPALV